MALTCTTPQIPKHDIWHSTKWSVLSNEKCLFSLFLLAYCVLINRVRVEAQFKPTLRGGVPMNLLRNCELKFVCVVLKWQCSLIQITRKKSSLASLLNHSLKEIITSQNLTFLFHQLTRRICQILIAIRNVAKKMKTKLFFLLNIFYFSVCLTSNKLYWIEDQLSDVSTRFYTPVSWCWRVEPSAI